MPKFQPVRDEKIFTQMLARVIARSDITDVSDSSVVKHILAAAARADGELYYQMSLLLQLFSIDTATGDDLDERAKDVQPSILTRRLATKAVGTVVFSRNGTTGTVSIPIGTKVKTASGVVFSTTVAGSIAPDNAEQIEDHGVGRDSLSIAVLADVAGSSGRVAAETVIKFGTKPTGVDEVTNLSAFGIAGLDKESDDDFRQRIKKFISSLARCTVQAIEAGVIGATDPETGAAVLFSRVVEDFANLGRVALYVDDGSGTGATYTAISGENVTLGLAGPPSDSAVGGETTLYLANKPIKTDTTFTLTSSDRGLLVQDTDYRLNPASGQIDFDPVLAAAEVITADYTYFTGIIALAQKIVDGDPEDRTNYPGLRAAGVLVIVAVPQILLQNVTGTLVVLRGFDEAEVHAAVEQVILDYINSLSISDDVLRNAIIKRVMSVPGVFDFNLITPAANVVLLDDQLPRTTGSNVSIS